MRAAALRMMAEWSHGRLRVESIMSRDVFLSRTCSLPIYIIYYYCYYICSIRLDIYQAVFNIIYV